MKDKDALGPQSVCNQTSKLSFQRAAAAGVAAAALAEKPYLVSELAIGSPTQSK